MGDFDQFANQGGPEQTPDEVADARRRAEERLRGTEFGSDLPEPLAEGDEPVVPPSPDGSGTPTS